MLPLPTSGSSFVAMKRRVTTIMLAESPRRLSHLGWVLVVALATTCLPLLLCPTSGSAQRGPEALQTSLEPVDSTATGGAHGTGGT
jgi:hypothetical protein